MAVNTVKSLSERIMRIISLGDVPNDSRFIIRDIDYAVRDNLGKQIAASWFLARNSKDALDISDAFISTITKSVQVAVNGDNFIDLDFDWVALPDDSGIQSARPATQGSLTNLDAFIPIPSRFNDIYRGLPANALETQIGWRLLGKKIFFTKKSNQSLIELGATTVSVDAISTSEVLVGQDKPLPIPPNIADVIVKEVSQFFLPLSTQGIKDYTQDNNSNIKPLA